MTALSNLLPKLSAYALLSYCKASLLKFGPYLLKKCNRSTTEGPLEFTTVGLLKPPPLLLSNATGPPKIKRTLTLGYLDDITLGVKAKAVARVSVLKEGCTELGFILNHQKC